MRHSAAAAVAAAVVVVVFMATTVGMTAAAEVPIAATENGRVSGTVEISVKGREFHSFYGLPFARPPLGKLRFKDPAGPPPPWEGTREASVAPPQCLQYPFLPDATGKFEATGDEDCLYLNVFAPKIKKDRALPVMVWIHGGAFFSGGALEYLPHVLLDQDIVLVVVQYRLGVLGFLSTEDAVMPGNLGLKDQTMALQWVQRNIHAFAGDKTRVTIFGESAGGASVHFQMLTPKSEGLFSRAILESGTALCPWAYNNAPRKVALHVAEAVGCSTHQDSESLLACLQAVDSNAFLPMLVELREWNIMPVIFAPWADGNYLPDHPAVLVREGRHAKVDIISGVTRDDGAIFTIPALAFEGLLKVLQSNFSIAGAASLQTVGQNSVSVARHFYNHYLGTTQVTRAHADAFVKLFSDRHFGVCHDLVTAHHAHHLHPAKKTFRYELQHLAELSLSQILCPFCGDQNLVCHGDELYYLFRGSPTLTPPIPNRPKDLRRPDDLALRKIITTLWTNFAATGNPTPDASLGFTWEPSTADNLQYLSLTPSPSMQPDNRIEVRKFHNSLPTKENIILHPHLVESGSYEAEDGPHSSKTEF